MNSQKQFITRRDLGRVFGVGAFLKALRASKLGAEPLQWEAQPDATRAASRAYRADAQVVLLSVTLLQRSGVGGGNVIWSEGAGVRLLEFSGYSLPERAAGLRRFGLIRELCRSTGDGAESIYFGLMTASPEESAAEARKALHTQPQSLLYSAIEGSVAPGDVATTTAHFMAPARLLSAAQHDELLEMARLALSAAPSKPPEFDPRAASEPTFLQAIASLLEDPSRGQTRYIYSGRLYRLWLRKSADPQATTYFRQKGLLPAGTKAIRAEGKLRREAGGKETNFRIWVEEGAIRPLPLRIEYQAKSYLRLTFEAE
jgi:hypothetical protein